jgi:acetylornithine/succinyldiaminopimelate/putrescine aminotransferase
MIKKNPQSIYQSISKVTLELIEGMNIQQLSTFISPTKFISPMSAQLAYILNEYYNHNRETSKKMYRSFFTNSRYEAIQGTIKLMRQNGITKNQNKVLILDSEYELEFIVNPLEEEEEERFLMPGIVIARSIEQMKYNIDQYEGIVGVILKNTKMGLSAHECSQLIERCRNSGIITAVEDSDFSLNDKFLIHQLSCVPDIIILGESLTCYEVPFAVFSMTQEVHEPWANLQTCTLHSSTYAGNNLSVTKARNTLLERIPYFKKDKEIMDKLDKIEDSFQEAIKCYNDYINPGFEQLYSFLGFDFLCKKAHGSWITIQDRDGQEKELLDTVIGGGACSRGHTPVDIVDNVISKHDITIGYFDKLQDKLNNILSFPYVFQAVSGATAVENALILMLLANHDKRRIITFKGNYSGKTLVSLIGTGEEIFHVFAQPIYKDVIYIDPFQMDAENILISELEKGDVALLWLEITRGTTVTEIPINILEIIQEYKNKMNYFIGVDEVLMGLYRGKNLTSYQDTPIIPDVLSFSKVFADATFPVGLTVVSEEVYKKAMARNSRIVSHIKYLYQNQFGANIALNVIDKINDNCFVEQIKNVSEILKKGMEEIVESTEIIDSIIGKGHIYKVNYRDAQQSIYYSKKAVQDENLFIFIDKILPPISMSEKEAFILIQRLKKLYKT